MIKLREIIVVEGKYDKIKLSRIFDAVIITTDGFEIYKSKSKMNMIKRLAQENGIIVLTDSDSAGFRIRNYLKQCIGENEIKNVYLPEIKGKEKRKRKPGAEGILGVEGISDEVIINAVMSQTTAVHEKKHDFVTKTDLYLLGLSGNENSIKKRTLLAKKMNLPVKMSSNALLEVINKLYTKDEFIEIINKL